MGYFKTWGWILLTVFILIGGFRLVALIVQWANKLCNYLMTNSDGIIEFLRGLLGNDALVGVFLGMLAFSPLLAFIVWLSD